MGCAVAPHGALDATRVQHVTSRGGVLGPVETKGVRTELANVLEGEAQKHRANVLSSFVPLEMANVPAKAAMTFEREFVLIRQVDLRGALHF